MIIHGLSSLRAGTNLESFKSTANPQTGGAGCEAPQARTFPAAGETAVLTSCSATTERCWISWQAGAEKLFAAEGYSLLTGLKSPWLTLVSEKGLRLGNRIREKDSRST